MVLTAAGRPDALDVEGVRAVDVVFVVRRGWVNDMVSGQDVALYVGTEAAKTGV